MTTISVITPTVSRMTLRRTLRNVAAQMLPGDEHLVIGDGPQWKARQMCADYGSARYLPCKRSNRWGNLQRDYAITQARGDYLVFCDDDDILAPGALDAVRSAVQDNPGAPFMFKIFDIATGTHRWMVEGFVGAGHVGGAMFVPPNNPNKLGRWSDDVTYFSDLEFIKGTLAHYSENALVWKEDWLCLLYYRLPPMELTTPMM